MCYNNVMTTFCRCNPDNIYRGIERMYKMEPSPENTSRLITSRLRTLGLMDNSQYRLEIARSLGDPLAITCLSNISLLPIPFGSSGGSWNEQTPEGRSRYAIGSSSQRFVDLIRWNMLREGSSVFGHYPRGIDAGLNDLELLLFSRDCTAHVIPTLDLLNLTSERKLQVKTLAEETFSMLTDESSLAAQYEKLHQFWRATQYEMSVPGGYRGVEHRIYTTLFSSMTLLLGYTIFKNVFPGPKRRMAQIAFSVSRAAVHVKEGAAWLQGLGSGAIPPGLQPRFTGESDVSVSSAPPIMQEATEAECEWQRAKFCEYLLKMYRLTGE